MTFAKNLSIAVVVIAVAISTIMVTIEVLRPPQVDTEMQLFEGVSYVRQARTTPRPLMIHIVEIDLLSPGIEFLVTPGDNIGGMELPARTTSDFLEEFGVQVAINGSFSEPFRVGNFLWDYYPHGGDPVNVTGLAISDGHKYSEEEGNHAVVCIATGIAQIKPASCPDGTRQALAGNRILVENGQPLYQNGGRTLHPRSAIAVNREVQRLWMIVIDGRQRGYSEGVTLNELADIAIELGASQALNLDGGGSSTLVMMAGGAAKVLNAPIHTRIPKRERPVANHLGVYARPPG